MKKGLSSLFIYLVLSLSFCILGCLSEQCKVPAPSSNFTLKNYEGFWYEIGKIQTKGGAFFEKDCVCTSLEVDILDMTTGDSNAVNCCRKKTPTASWTNATGLLNDMNPPGHWKER